MPYCAKDDIFQNLCHFLPTFKDTENVADSEKNTNKKPTVSICDGYIRCML